MSRPASEPGLDLQRDRSGIAALLAAAGLPPDSVVVVGAASEADRARAAQVGAPLLSLSRAPLGVAALDAVARPLGYRLSTDGIAVPTPEDIDPQLLRSLQELAGDPALTDQIRVPGDPESLKGCLWLDPYDRRAIPFEEACALLQEFVSFLLRDAEPAVGLNITIGKRRHLPPFIAFPKPAFSQHSRLDPAIAEAKAVAGRIIVWASWRHERAERACAEAGVPLVRVEDGFLRSVGLGAAFTRSMSLVADARGIYYDPSRPSDLEHLLEHGEIDAALEARAAALREAIVAANLTKYNVGPDGAGRIVPEGRTGVLVPGQVEDDASILRGASDVRTNLGLIAAARARWPDAFIIYKPHPDVDAGYRVGRVADSDALQHADIVVRDRSITALFAECAAIETMTSLAGFEGLMRGMAVATHGQPFYSGWGLTEDLAPSGRRSARRSLDQLVAATLILYPRYVDPLSGLPCGPELILRRLATARSQAGTPAGLARRHVRHALALFRHRILGPLLRRLT